MLIMIWFFVLTAARSVASSPPFCGKTEFPGMDSPVRLNCVDPSATITSIDFASFGNPVTDGDCTSWAVGSCNANTSLAVIEKACLGQNMCAVPTFDVLFGGNPCKGVSAYLAVVATCSGSSGGLSGAGASCAVNGSVCPVPVGWTQWDLTYSTVIEPGGDLAPGYFVPPVDKPFGLISLDWSVASSIWCKDNQNESTVEATLTENCRRIKAVSPSTRCFMYHNLELVLQAFESQRAVMHDPSKADWFVQYTDGAGHKLGRIYNEPGGPGDQYFWDFRNAAAADFYISSVLALTADSAVDGVFTDDYEGFPLEHAYGPLNTNMSFSEVAELQFASLAVHGRLIAALAAAGKYNWQAMGGSYEGEYTGPGVPQDASGCAAFMRERCVPAWQDRTVMMPFYNNRNANQSLAAFLITRGPVAFVGSGWESGVAQWSPVFLYAVGGPKGLCLEESPGVFSRPWTSGTVSLDCNKWVAVIPA